MYMKNKKLIPFCVITAFSLSLAVLDLPNAQPKVDAEYWKKALDKTWQGMIRRNIDPYENGKGLIHRPKSETPGDAVSEGVGYGMLVALFADDQEHFNSIWEAANQKMWGGCYYNWQMAPNGNVTGTGAASDAEEDVALALIFADKLVSSGKWKDYVSTKFSYRYADHAQKILNCMWETQQITGSGILAPGAGWGGNDFVNPGYFSPAWYKIFAQFDSNGDRWIKVVDKSYEILKNSPAYNLGMIPDWMQPNGGWVTGGLGYNAYFDSRAFFKDAIRILWRIAIDAIWFDEPRAKEFLKNSLTFINGKGGASAANYYQLENPGELLPEKDIWTDFNDNKNPDTWRYRREHSHLTIGMWATAAVAVGESADRIAFSEEMGKFYEGGDYFGLAVDSSGSLEDTLHNEMYFDQFLAWFGTAMMSGTFVNVIDAIDNPKQATPGDHSSLSASTKAPQAISPSKRDIKLSRFGSDVLFSAARHSQWRIYTITGHEIAFASGAEFLWKNAQRGVYIVTAQGNGFRYAKKISIF